MTVSIAIVGATGLVGSTLLTLLQEKSYPVDNLYLIASEQSAGKKISFLNQELIIYNLSDFDFSLSNLAFFCIGNELTAEYAPIAAKAGNIVIDKSNYFRQHPDVPLVIPEVNQAVLNKNNLKKMRIIASPNCNTIPVSVAIKPIYDAVGINRVNIATYQSVSGTGKEAIHELTEQTKQVMNHENIHPKIYPKQIAFNVLPHIDNFLENGYTLEEMKMVLEIQKLFGDDQLKINPTAVRVPVFYGHSAAVHLETNKKISVKEVCALLSLAPGIKLCQENQAYPTAVSDAAGKDPVFVGRIREDISHPHGINLWVVADNLRKGAALNALQIADYLIQNDILF
jgi:aspartate-semialdehyde dehydrogenase